MIQTKNLLQNQTKEMNRISVHQQKQSFPPWCPWKKKGFVSTSLTSLTSLSPPCRLPVASLASSFLNGEKTTFSILLVPGGQRGQRGAREAPERSLRKHKVPFFREVNISFADVLPPGNPPGSSNGMGWGNISERKPVLPRLVLMGCRFTHSIWHINKILHGGG